MCMTEPYDPLPDLAELTILCVQRATTRRHGTLPRIGAVLLRMIEGLGIEPEHAGHRTAWLRAFRTAMQNADGIRA